MTRQIDNDALDFPTSFESDKRSKKSAREDVNSSLVYLFTLHSWHLVLFFISATYFRYGIDSSDY